MIKTPPQLLRRYTSFIAQKRVPPQKQQYYVKWIRFYLDFCHKYTFQQGTHTSLSAFMDKLREKRRSEKQRKQAHHAVTLYFELVFHSAKNSGNKEPLKQKASREQLTRTKKQLFNQENKQLGSIPTVANKPGITENKILKSSGTDWTAVYSGLENAIKIRHYSPSTLKTYTSWTRKFQTYTRSKDFRLLSVDDVKEFLTWLAVEQDVAASSQNQAFNALLFVFRHVLGKEFGKVDGVVRAKRKPYIPVVLSRQEIDQVIALLNHPYRLIISLMYGSGLRISECLSLRVHNFNFDMKILTIHDGKGKKDRTVPIPDALMGALKAQLDRVIGQHERDCRAGYDGVFLPGQLEKKYKNAARELIWQWFLPAKGLTVVPDSKEQ